MAEETIRYIQEHDVVSLVDMSDAITALEQMLLQQGKGQVRNISKALGAWGDGCSMHALGSFMTEQGYAGFKTWMHTPRSGGSLFSLFDAHSGRLLALIEARALGMLRTAAITGVATKLLAPREARVAALIGTGPQAVTQLAALASVQPLDKVQVFSPTAEKRDEFVRMLSPKYGFEMQSCSSVDEVLQGAEIVTTITRATDAFIYDYQLESCRHINAIGAILPTKAEFSTTSLQRANLLVVDDKDNALKGSRELRELLGTEADNWAVVKTLGEMLASTTLPSGTSGLSFFKGMGMGISDLAIAGLVFERAQQQGIGIMLPAQTRQNLLLEEYTKSKETT